MALIPPDVGIRMRLQAESDLLQPLRPVHEIPADLPELRPGQRFSARIQEVLPDNTYKALVAGKQLTLQLPEGAKTNDLLELVVVDRTVRTIIAKQVEGGSQSADGTTPYEFAKFSPAARMIGQLLPAAGERPASVLLNRGQPLLAHAPAGQNAAPQLATALTQAVAHSGLFYEAHQAQWVTGQRPLEQLLQEPQGQRSGPSAHQLAAAERLAGRPLAAIETAAQSASAVSEKVGAGTTAPGFQVADDLRPLVQQQLETVATNRMFWHGEVWPQQTMQWAIERELEREGDDSTDDEYRWNTTLSLSTPRLGQVDALLQLTTQGVRIILATPYGSSAADLRDEAPKLAEALGQAGVPLLALQVRHEEEAATP